MPDRWARERKRHPHTRRRRGHGSPASGQQLVSLLVPSPYHFRARWSRRIAACVMGHTQSCARFVRIRRECVPLLEMAQNLVVIVFVARKILKNGG
jgi:hypothetical protein